MSGPCHATWRPWTSPARIGRVTGRLRPRPACDALLVTDLANIRYLTGFTGSAGAAASLLPGEPAVLVTDGRYEDQAAEELAGAGVEARVAVGPVAAGPDATSLAEVLARIARSGSRPTT